LRLPVDKRLLGRCFSSLSMVATLLHLSESANTGHYAAQCLQST
jgi:hypothetical protein